MNRLTLLGFGCAALAGCAATPQFVMPAPVAAPTFVVGEAWEYDFQSELDPAQNARYTQKVVATDGGQTTIELSGGRAGLLVLDGNANSLRFATGMFELSDQRLSFPMFVDRT
ncbi:hypothetical protein BHUM_03912c [Candidatus Burkholderia humilis]|nr:hypothetical protein BHUM_03912c [Candidatus Burkholderia humilis]